MLGLYQLFHYHYFYFPDDDFFLLKESEKFASQHIDKTDYTLKTRLIENLEKSGLKIFGLESQTKNIELLKKKGILAKNPYSSNSAIYHLATGKTGKWLDERAGILIPDNTTIKIPTHIAKNDVLHFSFLSPSLSLDSQKKELIVFAGEGKDKKEVLRKQIQTYLYNENFHGKADSSFPDISQKSGWYELEIDLSNLPPGPNMLTFTVNSEKEELSFLGNPIIFSKKPTNLENYNIVYVVYDAMSRNYLSIYNPDSQLTPFLESNKQRFILFDRMYSCATKTRTFLTGFFTGKSPLETRHGISFNIYPEEEKKLFYQKKGITTLAQSFKKNNYLAIQIGNSGFSNPVLETAFNYDFDSSFDFQSRPYDTTGATYHVLKSLSKNKPFFLYVHLNTTHTPRRAPLKYYFSSFHKYFSHLWRLDMLAATQYADNNMKILHDYLEKSGLLEKTILIFTSDHGSGHDLKKFFSNYNYDDYVRVPFVIFLPEKLKAKWGVSKKKIETATTVLNLAPTFLDFLGFPKENNFSGKSIKDLFSKKESPFYTDEFIWSYDNFGLSVVFQGRWKYILQFIGGRYRFSQKEYLLFGKEKIEPTEQLYDLVEDPDESVNLTATKPEILKQIRNKILHKSSIPEINFVSIFPGEHQNKEKIDVIIEGKETEFLKFQFLNPSSKYKIVKIAKGYHVSIELNEQNQTLLFETEPTRSPITIKLLTNGRLVPKQRLFTGPYNLNWYENPLSLSKNEDYLPLLMKKIPALKTKSQLTSFHYGRIDLRWWMFFSEKKAQGEIGANMQEVLKAWGYIQ